MMQNSGQLLLLLFSEEGEAMISIKEEFSVDVAALELWSVGAADSALIYLPNKRIGFLFFRKRTFLGNCVG